MHTRRARRPPSVLVHGIVRGIAAAALALAALAAAVGAPAQARPASSTGAGNYTAISPQRFLDTRPGRVPLAAGSTTTYQLAGGHGVPAAGVAAVLLNLTAVGQSYGGYLTAFPAGTTRPLASDLNFPARTVVANQVLVPLDRYGRFSLYSYVSVHVVIDVVGWASSPELSPGAADVVPVQPARLLDTRSAHHPLTAGATTGVQVTGRAGVPAGASAAILNVTAVGGRPGAYLTVYPAGTARPGTSSLTTSQSVIANQVVAPIGAQGRVTVFSAGGPTDVVVDVEGYVSAGVGGFVPAGPVRLADTRRVGSGAPLPANHPLKLAVAGVAGVPADATSVMINLTTVSLGGGYSQAGPYGGLANHSSVLNFAGPAVTSATVSVAIGPSGAISVGSSATAHEVVDLLGWTTAPSLSVTPPTPDLLARSAPPGDATALARQILDNTDTYAMTTWWDTAAQVLLATPLDAAISAGAGSDPVRRLANQAFGLATALALGTYDPATAGVSADTALSRTITVIDYVARQHVANHDNGWGSGWQSSFWAGYLARAAWLLWPQLPDADRTYVAKMIRFEADDVAGRAPHYLRDRSGRLVGPAGDTGSDDTSWWAMPMQLAAVMLPDDPHAAIWRYTSALFALAAWSRPADTTNATVVQGAPVSTWLQGSNVETDGTVVNHARIAPDYMTLLYQSTDDIWLHALVGRPAPQADTALAAPVYAAYTGVTYDLRDYRPPGGTIYPDGQATVYYPQGNDWGLTEILPYALTDGTAVAYRFGTTTAASYLVLHEQAQLQLQQRFADRHTYLDDTEYRYVGREEQTAQLAAELYLALYTKDNQLISFENDAGPLLPTRP